MRLRQARKIYFPKDVSPVYKATTIDKALRRLERTGRYKWQRWCDYPLGMLILSHACQEKRESPPLPPLPPTTR